MYRSRTRDPSAYDTNVRKRIRWRVRASGTGCGVEAAAVQSTQVTGDDTPYATAVAPCIGEPTAYQLHQPVIGGPNVTLRVTGRQ